MANSDDDKGIFAVNASFQETGLYTHLQTPNIVRHRVHRPRAQGPRADADGIRDRPAPTVLGAFLCTAV